MNISARILLLLALFALSLLFFFPLWQITLEAPQYPGGITMYIWIYQITGDTDFTLQNINILNHYIGMAKIEPDAIPELVYFPFVVAGLMAAGTLAIWLNKQQFYLFYFLLLAFAATAGLVDFYLWEYDYGHNLDPLAPIKVPGMTYQPPLIGEQYLLNFKASSWPSLGGVGLALALLFSALAAAKSLRQKVAIPVLALLLGACSRSPRPIEYGQEQCDHCLMTIIDPRYGSQLVTNKGKVYCFDSVECLVEFHQSKVSSSHLLLATAYDQPGQLSPVNDLRFTIDARFPSPMGANLTAFSPQTPPAQDVVVLEFDQLPSKLQK